MDTAHRTSNQQLECPICNYSSSSEAEISQHIEKHHAFKCKECNKEFLSCPELISHDYEEHRTDTVESSTPPTTTYSHCGHTFNSKNELDTHTETVHGIRNQLYDCPICSYRSTSENDVTRHVEERHAFTCKECPTECSSKEELDDHISEIHYTEHINAHKCNRCHHEFLNKHELKQHMSVVHDKKEQQENEIRFQCDKCRVIFMSEDELKNHDIEYHVVQSRVKNTLLIGDSNTKFQNPRLKKPSLAKGSSPLAL